MKALLDIVQELSFVRTGGSAEEKAAAEILLREIAEAGGQGEEMLFQIQDARVDTLRMEAMGREIPCFAYTRSGNLQGTFAFRYLERGEEMDFLLTPDLSGTIVMVNSVDEKVYKRLTEHHAAAFISVAGSYYNPPEAASVFYSRPMREHFTRHGMIPGFQIHAKDATELVASGAETITIHFEEENVDKTSRNVLSRIPGTERQSEPIVLTAHYDSVPVGRGAWDNATGAAALLGIYRYFVKHPAKRPLQFIWCGSEELGLLGAKAYIAQHEKEMEDIRFCFNFDMCGTTLGNNSIFATGDKALETFIQQYCKRVGYAADISTRVHSSDSSPFCDRGIPALGLSRGTRTAEIHTHRDLMAPLSASAIEKNTDFAIGVIGEVANAAVIPVDRGMPEDIRKELDKYFHRDTDAKK